MEHSQNSFYRAKLKSIQIFNFLRNQFNFTKSIFTFQYSKHYIKQFYIVVTIVTVFVYILYYVSFSNKEQQNAAKQAINIPQLITL